MPPVASRAWRVRWPVRLVLPVVAGLIGALLLAGCSSEPTAKVRTATATRATVTQVVDAPGTVTPRAQATLSAPASGTVTELLVDEGAHVRAGQVIMRLRSPQAQQSLRQARQALAQLQSAPATGSSGPVTPAVPGPGAAPAAPTDPAQAARAASEAAAAAFQAARAAAAQITDPQARAAALTAVATAQQQAQAAAVSAATQTAGTLDALTRQLAALQSQTQMVLATLSAAAQNATTGVASTVSALSASQRAQAQAAVATAQATVDALTVRAPISGLVSFDTSGAGSSVLDSAGGLSLGSGVTGGLGGLGGSGSLPGGGVSGGAQVTGPPGVGSPVRVGQVLATVTDTSEVTVTVDIDETDVLAVRPGVPATVLVDAVPGARYTARVLTVAPTPQAAAGGAVVYPARLALRGGTWPGPGRLPDPRPGMSAVVDLVVRRAPDALSVPVAAVFRSGEQDWVWQVRDGRLHRQRVHLGAEGSDRVQILSGLSEGDVVAAGQSGQLREGQRVE
jgi:multidrug efflux pump subunit AcrA (membrane-fusion protein)